MHQGAWFLGGVIRPPLYPALGEWRAGTELAGGVDWRGAATHYERAIELDPEFWTTYPFLWFSYKALREDDKAAACPGAKRPPGMPSVCASSGGRSTMSASSATHGRR